MKILIIGEYSGFAKYLSRGFNAIGHEACAFSWGDTFKKIDTEKDSISIDIYNYTLMGKTIRGSNYIKRIFSSFKLQKKIKLYKSYFDCVLIINPTFIKRSHSLLSPYPTIKDVKSMLKNKEMIYLSACGNDFIFNSYLPYRGKTSEYYRNKYYSNIKTFKEDFYNIIGSVKGVIPVMLDYAAAYRKFINKYNYKLYNTIPLPYDTDNIEIKTASHSKIVIFHGITRSKEKGSEIIIEALNKLSQKYQDLISIKIVSGVPLNEYLSLMRESDIVIDQCYAYSYGMNAIEALAGGKIVLSGNETGNPKEFGIKSCPVINIKPDVANIYEALDKLINDPELRRSISKESTIYARKVHNCKIVASKYINLFKEDLNK